jgi:hypothetical protein
MNDPGGAHRLFYSTVTLSMPNIVPIRVPLLSLVPRYKLKMVMKLAL